jgi:hypothetical protein
LRETDPLPPGDDTPTLAVHSTRKSWANLRETIYLHRIFGRCCPRSLAKLPMSLTHRKLPSRARPTV